MTNQTSQIFESYVPVYDTVPEKWEDARQFLVEHLKKISNAVNIREIGWFLDEELISGKQFIPGVTNPQQFRTVLRKIINFGAMPNATTKQVAHGINVGNPTTFTLIHMWASATNPTNGSFAAFSIPLAGNVITSDISLTMDMTNVYIGTAGNYSAYTITYVFIEYLQET